MREQSDGISQQADDVPMELMAKRPRVNMNRDSKIVKLHDEVEGCASRFSQDPHPTFQAVFAHIGGMQTFTVQVGAMDSPTAKNFAKAISGTTTEVRVGAVSKIMSGPHYLALQKMEQQIQHAKQALRAAAELSLTTGYATAEGLLQWEKMHDDLLTKM